MSKTIMHPLNELEMFYKRMSLFSLEHRIEAIESEREFFEETFEYFLGEPAEEFFANKVKEINHSILLQRQQWNAFTSLVNFLALKGVHSNKDKEFVKVLFGAIMGYVVEFKGAIDGKFHSESYITLSFDNTVEYRLQEKNKQSEIVALNTLKIGDFFEVVENFGMDMCSLTKGSKYLITYGMHPDNRSIIGITNPGQSWIDLSFSYSWMSKVRVRKLGSPKFD